MMIVSVHQPHYLPWLGYFDKMASSDAFVFLDMVQYKRREFQNRNKIRTGDGWVWLTVPVISKGRYNQRIYEVAIDNTINWQSSHWGKIKTDYDKAPYFKDYSDFFEEVYTNKWDRLTKLNIYVIKYLLACLDIDTPLYLESDLETKTQGTERIIQICKKLGADTYLSGVGGKVYLDEAKLARAGINLEYQDFHHPQYQQQYPGFEPYMSVIDLLFNHGKDSLKILRGE